MAKKKGGSPLFLIILIVGSIFAIFGLVLTVSLFVPEYPQPDLFSTLPKMQAYMKIFPDSPPRDNKNIIKPEFDSFHASMQPGFFGKTLGNLMCYAGISSPRPWSSNAFAQLMQQLVKAREAESLKGMYLQKLYPNEKTKFIVIGDLMGASHSLVRDLTKLKELNIIDDSLKITDENIYIISLGSTIGRSAYGMETLMILMRLMEKNPKQFFYIKGNHENNDYWQSYGFKQELMHRAADVKEGAGKFPLEALVNQFFNTLPVALYVGIPPDLDENFVRFSHEGGAISDFTIEKIDADCYQEFLLKKLSDKLSSYTIQTHPDDCPSVQNLATKVIIRSEVKRKSFQKMDGMRQLTPENGVVTWTVMSCPTQSYQEGMEFFFDAFGLIEAAEKIEDWKITLYSQDVRQMDGYKVRACNFLSGEEIK